jgi:2-keto-4-pentenoate hydratase/2-oxohepta-3-ene-1,7-dioic acid hydratase in catechol pathway
MKIFAVGMNYPQHNKEIKNTLLQQSVSDSADRSPVIFTKADSALLKDGKPFFIPDFMGRIDYETEIVVRICKLGKSIPERFAHRYYDAVTVGIDFTARDLQKKLREEGQPWEICKGLVLILPQVPLPSTLITISIFFDVTPTSPKNNLSFSSPSSPCHTFSETPIKLSKYFG